MALTVINDEGAGVAVREGIELARTGLLRIVEVASDTDLRMAAVGG